MEEDITIGGLYVNLNAHSFLTGAYKLSEVEMKLTKSAVYNAIPKEAIARGTQFYCQECGNEVTADDRYCRFCGKRLR